MKKPVVDYTKFRLSKLKSPEYSHLLLLLGWPAYFLMYLLTENLIPYESCHVIYSPLDDMIPFCEWFVIPYVGWYVLIVATLLYFMLYNVENFRRLQIFIIITQVTATAIYILYPNRQDLRPDVFLRENPLTNLVGLLYAADTSTNVCPSLHVAISIGIASVWLKEKSAGWIFKTFMVIICLMVCLSTVFIKQHSVVDGFVAIPVCIIAEIISCGGYWKSKLKRAGK